MTFSYQLTDKDKALTRMLMQHLNRNKQTYFTSDDLRRCTLKTRNPKEPHKLATLYDLFDDPQHDIGAYFSKLKFHGFIKSANREVASSVPSNNNRKVDVWRWHHRVEAWLDMKPISAYGSESVISKESP